MGTGNSAHPYSVDAVMDTTKMVFVFGSNLSGIHGAGAARVAHAKKNYPWGISFGLHGAAFGIPTKNRDVRTTLELDRIKYFVDEFISQADTQYTKLNFQVTAIGCGLAGLRHEDVAPMFINAPDNCYFDTLWKNYLPTKNFWGSHP